MSTKQILVEVLDSELERLHALLLECTSTEPTRAWARDQIRYLHTAFATTYVWIPRGDNDV